MTPFELDILLHYYTRCEDHEVVHRHPPIWPETRAALFNEGVIERVPKSSLTENYTCTYRLTERGKAYIEYVLAVPLPVVKWVLPDAKDWRGSPFPEKADRNFLSRHDDIGER